jgi:hypothetical protein
MDWNKLYFTLIQHMHWKLLYFIMTISLVYASMLLIQQGVLLNSELIFLTREYIDYDCNLAEQNCMFIDSG